MNKNTLTDLLRKHAGLTCGTFPHSIVFYTDKSQGLIVVWIDALVTIGKREHGGHFGIIDPEGKAEVLAGKGEFSGSRQPQIFMGQREVSKLCVIKDRADALEVAKCLDVSEETLLRLSLLV
jgi:hypothetical protein